MILGKIIGKTTTTKFEFEIQDIQNSKKFSFVQVYHPDYDTFVLAQIYEVERTQDKSVAKCEVLGIKEKGLITPLTIPLPPGSEVMLADKQTLQDFFSVNENKGIFIGVLEQNKIPIYLDLENVLSKHIAILAKTGSGKSYTAGVIVEELLEKNVPVVIIDPHGEYHSLKIKNQKEEELKQLYSLGLKEKGYDIEEWGNYVLIPRVKQLKLNPYIKINEIPFIFPKLSPTQNQLIYNLFKDNPIQHLNDLIVKLELEESSAKWPLLNYLHFLKSLNIFDDNYVNVKEFIKPGVATIINLRGYNSEIQQIIAYKLISELFDLRKEGKVPSFFLLLEEVHNFAPERSFGEAKTSKLLRTIASEGRKFGLSLGLVTQRPVRLDKNVLSQAHTYIILKITNPNDLGVIAQTLEGADEFLIESIKSLPIGHIFLAGTYDVPIKVKVRPRKSLHGGVTVISQGEEENSKDKSLELIILTRITKTEFALSFGFDVKQIKTVLWPAYYVNMINNKGKELNLVIEGKEGKIVANIDKFETLKLPDFEELSQVEIILLKEALKRKKFTKKGLLQATKIEEDAFDKLLEKGYFKGENGIYSVSNEYLFSSLEKVSTKRHPDLKEISYDEKKEFELEEEWVKQKLHKFGKINSIQKIFLVKYESIN